MSPRVRKLIGLLAIVVFLAAYVVAVVSIGARLPDNWLAKLALYGPAGFLWGVPLFPLIRWMNRER